AADHRRHHEPVAGKAGRDPEARLERTDQWLEIGRVLVEAGPGGLDTRVEERRPASLGNRGDAVEERPVDGGVVAGRRSGVAHAEQHALTLRVEIERGM